MRWSKEASMWRSVCAWLGVRRKDEPGGWAHVTELHGNAMREVP